MFVEKSDYALDYIHFRNSVGTLIKVCVNDHISFRLATGYSTPVSLASLFDRRQKDFPLHVQFAKQQQRQQEKIPKRYLDFGMLTLSDADVVTMDVVIASANVPSSSSSEHVVVYPLRSSGVKFEVNDKLKLASDKGYRELCAKHSSISVEDAVCYLAEMVGFKQAEHKVMMKYKKMKKDVQRSVSFAKKDGHDASKTKGGTYDVSSDVVKIIDDASDSSKSKKKTKEKKEKSSDKICVDKEKKSDKEEEKATKTKKTEKEKKKKHSTEKKESELIPTENIYTPHPPSLLSKVRSIKIRKDKKRGGGAEVKNVKPIVENLYTQIDYEFLDKIQDEIAKSPSLPLRGEAPPPLPGNHPKMKNDGYEGAIDSKTVDGFR